MLYYLFEYLKKEMNFPGAGLFQYISFRAALAIITSLLISMVFGKNLINKLRSLQVADEIRDLGLAGEKQKQGTPTMGGLIILAAILIPTFLFARINNVYIILSIAVTVWLGAVGFMDDYIKVFKKNKEGLAGRFKIIGQVGISVIVATTLYFNVNVKTKEFYKPSEVTDEFIKANNLQPQVVDDQLVLVKDEHSTITTIPFFKSSEFDYADLG
jgi:phospho-N-acetylmuramoyl-pentapeptide-transferase